MIVNRVEDICNGRPTIKGTRLEVFNIVTDLYFLDGDYKEYIHKKQICKTDLIEIIDYCESLSCQKMDKATDKYCSGCVLSTLHEDFNYRKFDLEKLQPGIYIDKNNENFRALGKKDDIENELFGIPGWIRASEIVLKE